MEDLRSFIAKKVGTPPETLVYTGKEREEASDMTLLVYNEKTINQVQSAEFSSNMSTSNKKLVHWLNIERIHNIPLVEQLGEHFELHNLLLEDVLNTHEMPKVEDFGDYLFLTLKSLKLHPATHKIELEHISFVLKDNYLISFKEHKNDLFLPVIERVMNNKGKARKKKADYLLYLLLDLITDNYYLIIDYLSTLVAKLEEEIIEKPTENSVKKIVAIKKQLLILEKTVYPLRDAFRKIAKEDFPFIQDDTYRYLDDINDHVLHLIEHIENQREILSSCMDIYMSGINNRINKVMQILTIISTIFIPLTFIVGIYGMNFTYMPELDWKWGYPAVMAVMLAFGIYMYFYMKRKKWL